jgi:hypothetical protein
VLHWVTILAGSAINIDHNRQISVTLRDKKVKRWYPPPLASTSFAFYVVIFYTLSYSIKYECPFFKKLTDEGQWRNKRLFPKSEKVVR